MKGLHKNSLRKVDNPHQWMIDDARMELIQQIKAEIIKRIDKRRISEQAKNELVSILSFLSDLEKEEKPTLQEQPVDWQKVAEAHAKDQPLGQDNDGNLVYLKEQPVKIDIRKELASIEFMGVNDARDTETIARHFYALGQQSKPKVSEGLEEAAERYEHNRVYQDELEKYANYLDSLEEGETPQRKEPSPETKYFLNADIIEAFKAGAKWQKEQDEKMLSVEYLKGVEFGKQDTKEQMMKEWLKDRDGCFWDGVNEGKKAMKEQMMKGAVEYEVGMHGEPIKITFDKYVQRARGIFPGDKVRIVIVKED